MCADDGAAVVGELERVLDKANAYASKFQLAGSGRASTVAGARAIMTSLMFSESSWSMFHGFSWKRGRIEAASAEDRRIWCGSFKCMSGDELATSFLQLLQIAVLRLVSSSICYNLHRDAPVNRLQLFGAYPIMAIRCASNLIHFLICCPPAPLKCP